MLVKIKETTSKNLKKLMLGTQTIILFYINILG